MFNPDFIRLEAELSHPQYMRLTGLVIIFFLIIGIIFLIKYFKNKHKRNLFIVIISLIIIIGAIGCEVFIFKDYQYQLNYNILDYSIILYSNSNEKEVVYVPISENNDLQKSTKIKSGTGSISIIDTLFGIALKVNFSNKIDIHGKIDTTSDIGNHDLSLGNQTERYRNVEYWIFYEPNNSVNYNCSLTMKLNHESLAWSEEHKYEGYLKEEWNVYLAEHHATSY